MKKATVFGFFALPVLALMPLQNHKEIRTVVEQKKEVMMQRREEFRQRVAQIRDERKRKIVENLDVAYDRINQRWTTHFNQVLDRLEAILRKIEVRAEGRAAAEISQTYQLITEAREAVAAQAAKVYTIQISDETGLRKDARVVHRHLRLDLTALRASLKEVREAIHNLLRILAGAEATGVVRRQSVSSTSEDGHASATAESVVIVE